MKVISGDLIKLAVSGKFDCIIHGCNCFNTMGAGVAKAIRLNFPKAYEIDQATQKGFSQKLGTISYAKCITNGCEILVVNAYTQFYYGRESRCLNYDALRSSLKLARKICTGKRIGYPMIGTGLAGGDWNIIKPIIDDELNGENHTLVVLNNLNTYCLTSDYPKG